MFLNHTIYSNHFIFFLYRIRITTPKSLIVCSDLNYDGKGECIDFTMMCVL